MRGTAGRSGMVALGVAGSGLGTIAMLATASRLLGVEDFAVFATWWVAASLVIFPLGVFETLLTRQVVSDLVADRQAPTATSAIAIRAVTLVAPVALALCVADPVLADHVFHGTAGLGVSLAVYLILALAQTLERGYAAGNDRFGVVALLLGLDGVTRAAALAVCAALGAAGVHGATIAVLIAASGTSFIGSLLSGRGWFARPHGRHTSVSAGTTILLLAGSLGPILISNASVPWLSSHGGTAVIVGSFSGALTLSRIPIQLSGAAFGPLLRRLAHTVDLGDDVQEHREYRQALIVSLVVAVLFVAAFTALGDPLISAFLGARYGVPTWTYALLGTSGAGMMVAVVVQVRAAARERWGVIAGAWMIAAAGFVVTLSTPGTVLLRCSLAPAVGTVLGLLVLAFANDVRTTRTNM